jgi:acyl-CoA thioester hydrolase
MPVEHTIQLRVRYNECDPGGYLHHANYFAYFEIARTELLRVLGGSYRQMEENGVFAVVVRAACRYRRPARYDDLLDIHVRVVRTTHAKIEHRYEVLREGQSLANAEITLALVDRQGTVQRVPEDMMLDENRPD